jgi:hypothetical protein
MTFKVKSGIRVNTVDVIDSNGNFTGNAYQGINPVAISYGGTGADTAPNARVNLFTNVSTGFVNRKSDGTVISRTIESGTGVSISNGNGDSGNPTISIGQNVATSSDVTFANVTVNGKLFSNDITATSITADGDLTVVGNLIILGDTTTVNSETVNIEDNELILNSSLNDGTSPTLDALLTVNRGSAANTSLRWNETTDRWQFTNSGNEYFNIPTPEEYDNTIYTVSIEAATNAANLVLTGTNRVTNDVVTDKVKFVGAGLVTVSRQDDNTIVINGGGSISTKTIGIRDSVANVIDYFSITEYRSAEYYYTIDLSNGNEFATGKLLVLHDGTTTWQTQFAMLQTVENDELVNFQTDINNGNVRLLAQATTGNIANVTLTQTSKADI